MKIVFSNQQTIELSLDNSRISHRYQKIYKHLCRIQIPFRAWDSPYYWDNKNYAALVDRLIMYAHKLQIDIDKNLCLAHDQEYFNHIHRIYEQNYNGDPDWLDFHEHIHFCESFPKKPLPFLHVDYREKAGPLVRDVEPGWYDNMTTDIRAGDVYAQWSELGKSPYTYWKNKEPNDIKRLCELAKPWINLHPVINVALEDFSKIQNLQQVEEFNTWWKQYHDQWTEHWKVPAWDLEKMFGVIVFGKTTQVELLKNLLKNGLCPEKVVL